MGLQKVAPAQQSVAPRLPQYDARDLIKSGEQAQIILDDQVYVLRSTRAGKLILTK